MLYNHIFFDIHDNLKIKTVAFLTVFHIVLGILIRMIPNIAVVHVIMTIFIGSYFVFKNFKIELGVLVIYISAIELTWRMAGSKYIFWEGGKYYISFLLLLGVLKNIYNNKSFSFYPVIYILLMSLSTVLLDFDAYRALKMLSFNLSGHICLGV